MSNDFIDRKQVIRNILMSHQFRCPEDAMAVVAIIKRTRRYTAEEIAQINQQKEGEEQ